MEFMNYFYSINLNSKLVKIFLSIFSILLISNSVCNSQSRIQADSLCKKFLNKCQYDSALFYAEEVAALIRGTVGENSIQYAHALDNLVVSHFYLGNYKKAKYYALKETTLLERSDEHTSE